MISGRTLAGDDQRVRLVFADDGNTVGSFDFVQRRLHRALKHGNAGGMWFLAWSSVVEVTDQNGQHLGVGLAL